MQKSKLDLLKKYLPNAKPKRTVGATPNGDSSHSNSDQSNSPLPERIDSDNEQSQEGRQKRMFSKDQRMKRKFREALGADHDEQLDDFLTDQLVIQNVQGIDLSKIGRKGVKLTMQGYQAQQQYGDEHNVKLEEYMNTGTVKAEPMQAEGESSQSDIQVDRNASKQFKTVYRNKDGTIRQESIQVQKQRHEQQVYQKLGEWSKGMRQAEIKQKPRKSETFGNTDISDDYKIELAQREMFEDPMRVIKTTMGQIKQEKKLFACKYSGLGNRFNIAPGHRWDGVVRGSGFQWKYMKTKTEAQQRQDEQMRQYLQSL